MTTEISGVRFGDITLQNLSSMVSIDLNNSMQWIDRFDSQQVAGTVDRSLGGSVVVFRASLINGRAITLQATQDSGWIPSTQAAQLEAWAAITDPNVRFRLTFFTEVYDVLFAHFSSPAVSLRQLQARQLQTGGWYVGTLKFYTV